MLPQGLRVTLHELDQPLPCQRCGKPTPTWHGVWWPDQSPLFLCARCAVVEAERDRAPAADVRRHLAGHPGLAERLGHTEH